MFNFTIFPASNIRKSLFYLEPVDTDKDGRGKEDIVAVSQRGSM